MFHLRSLLMASILAVTMSAVSEAQSLPSQGSYQVQVQVEHWFTGATHWRTVLETNDFQEAELVYQLLDMAYLEGNIYDFVHYDGVWFVRDVRMIANRDIPTVDWDQWTLDDLDRFYRSMPRRVEIDQTKR